MAVYLFCNFVVCTFITMYLLTDSFFLSYFQSVYIHAVVVWVLDHFCVLRITWYLSKSMEVGIPGVFSNTLWGVIQLSQVIQCVLFVLTFAC